MNENNYHSSSNKTIPKSSLRNKSSGKNSQVNTSLNMSTIDRKQLQRDKSSTTKQSSNLSSKNQDIMMTLSSKYERENLKSNDSTKQISSKSKKSKKAQSSMNSSKIHSSQGTLEQIVSSSNLHSKNNNSYQSLSNIGDITANFNSLQNSTRLNYNQQNIIPYQEVQGYRSNSQGNIINIQTPKNNGIATLFNPLNQNSGSGAHQSLPSYNIQLCQQNTERSNSSLGTDYSKGAPVTATIVNPSQSSNVGSIHILNNQYQRPQNFSMSQRNSYSPVNRNSASHKKSSRHQTSVSPAKYIEALSFQNTQIAPLPNLNHGAIIFQKLELFWKERLLKLNQSIQQIREGAYQKDDIIKTMLENTETANYADQRIIELIKEGVNIEQELQIEQLSKQLIIQQSDALQTSAQRDHLINEYQKLASNSQIFQNDMEIIIDELKKKKQKYKSRLSVMDELKIEIKQVKDEKENLLEKLKIFQNQTSEKQIYSDQRVEEIQKNMKDMEIQKEQLQNKINQMKDEIIGIEKKHDKEIQNLHQNYQEQIKSQKRQLKDKYLNKVNEVESQLQTEFKTKIKEIQMTSDTKSQSQSKLDKQTIEFLQKEVSRLNSQLQDTVSVKEHETILNHKLNQVTQEHENEIETIKQAFEQELRKAEKQVRQNLKKEEEKLRLSALEYEKSMEYEKSEKLKIQSKYNEEIILKESQISKLKDKMSVREKELVNMLDDERKKIKQMEHQMKQIEQSKREEVDYQKLEYQKVQVNQSLNMKELQAKIEQLTKELDNQQILSKQQMDSKQGIIKERDMQLKHLQTQYHLIDNENIDLKKRIKDLEQQILGKQDELLYSKDKYQQLLIKLKEVQNSHVWKLEREQEKIKRLNQDFTLLKKLLKSDLEFTTRDIQSIVNQTSQTLLKKHQKIQQQLQISLRNIPNEEYQQLKNSFDIINKEKTSLSEQFRQANKEIEELKSKSLQDQGQYQLSQQLQEKLHNENLMRCQKQIDESLKEIEKLGDLNQQMHDELNQSRQENAILLQKMGELDTIFQELDFKLKNSENEKEIYKQQLQFEEKSKHEESNQLRQQFQSKQDQLIADFREQCMKLRGEIEESYNNKLKNKVNNLKNKQQDEINDINKQVEKREAELQEKYNLQLQQYEQQFDQLNNDLIKVKKDYKKLMHKYKLGKQKDQENISKIEEEIFKSLAKVNTSAGSLSRKQANYSFVSQHNKNQHSTLQVDRSFQNLTNNSMFQQHSAHSRDKNDMFRNNLTLQSLKNINNNQSFNTLLSPSSNLLQNQSAITHVEYPKSTRNTYYANQQNQKGGFIHNQENISVHQSLVIQDKNARQQKISPISKSLNQTDISPNSSFIIPANGNINWNPLRSNLRNQVLTIEDSQNSQTRNKLQESSLNRVLNISGDALNMNGGGNNDSFLVARSLSPKEKTGKFGKPQNVVMNVSQIKTNE